MNGRTPPIGSLRDRVQIQRKDVSALSSGGSEVTFVPLATVWARVHQISERAGEISDGRGARISHSVVMRFRSDIATGDRLVYRGRALEVIAAEDLNGRRAYLNCSCTETRIGG